MSSKLPLCSFAIGTLCMTQAQRTPDLEVQRAAMKKLGFLIGRWTGEARLLRGPDQWMNVAQTEEAQYRLSGLILTIEGVGRTATERTPILEAFGVICYNDATGAYKMRAFNDGRFLECEVKLLDDGIGIKWGFSMGEVKTSSVLRITDEGDWTEHAEIMFGSHPPQKLMELKVSPRR